MRVSELNGWSTFPRIGQDFAVSALKGSARTVMNSVVGVELLHRRFMLAFVSGVVGLVVAVFLVRSIAETPILLEKFSNNRSSSLNPRSWSLRCNQKGTLLRLA